jgi:hypothetical protein
MLLPLSPEREKSALHLASHLLQSLIYSLVRNGSDESSVSGEHGTLRGALPGRRRLDGLQETSRDTGNTDETLALLSRGIF